MIGETSPRGPIAFAQILLSLFLALAVFLSSNFWEVHAVQLPGVSIRIDQIIFLSLGVLGAICLLFLPPRLDRRISVWFLILIPIWFFGALQSETRAFTLSSMASFIVRGFVPAFLASAVVRTRGPRFIVRLIIVTAAVVTLLGIGQWIFARGEFLIASKGFSGRISSTIGHPIPMAAFLLAAWPLTAECLTSSMRLLIGGGIGICVIGSQSRGELVIGVGILLLYLKARPEAKALVARMTQVVIMGLALTAGVLFFTHRAVLAEWTHHAGQRWSLTTLKADAFHSHRIASYHTTANMLKAHFWLGGGLGTFPLRYTRYEAAGSVNYVYSPDNLYLRMLADTGVIGFFAFLSLLLLIFTGIRSAIVRFPETAEMRQALLISFIGLLLSSFLFDSLFWPPILLQFVLITVLAVTPWPS